MNHDLLGQQRRFLAAILEPLAGEDRSLAGLTGGRPEPSPAFTEVADELIVSTPGLAAPERLALYQRQYWFRILDSLAEDFPNVRRFLGEEAFHSTMEAYLLDCPSSSWTLRGLGKAFSGFLGSFPGIAPERRPWASALGAYDFAHMQAFEAARLPLPGDDDLASRPLLLQPDVVVVPVSRPISLLVAADRPPRDVGGLRHRRELHVIWRSGRFSLETTREPVSVLPLLRALQKGGRLEDLLERAHPLPSPAAIEAAFARWRARGWIALSNSVAN